MKNFNQPGNILDMVAPVGGVTSGEGYLFGSIFGVAVADAAEGETFGLLVEGVVELAKNTSTALSVGDPVEWDDTAKELVAAAAGDLDAGYAVEDKLAADTTVKIKISRP